MTENTKQLYGKFLLSACSGDELRQLADKLLDDGYYTPELAEIALCPYPTMADLLPVMRRAAETLALPTWSRNLAIEYYVNSALAEVGSASDPFAVLDRLHTEVIQLKLPDDHPVLLGLWAFYFEYDVYSGLYESKFTRTQFDELGDRIRDYAMQSLTRMISEETQS